MKRREKLIVRIEEILAADHKKSAFFIESMDIAEFKQINYHYGYDAGNQFLEELESFIKKIPQCILCEWVGSDHFLFMTKHEKEIGKEEVIDEFNFWLNKFTKETQSKFLICPLKVWCGIYRISGDDIQLAIENADLARQKARKLHNKNVLYCEESLVDEVLATKEQESRILHALRAERFTFWLQPQVDIRTGEILSAEALARGSYETGEIISPAVFVPVLEKSGDIITLDLLILKQVCRTLRDRLDRGEPVIPISVNFSRIDLRDQEFVSRIGDIVSCYRIPHECLVFELTEDVLIESFSPVQNVTNALKRLGYKISIDDFGSGYAGIDICRKLDFDELKIDKSLVDGFGKKDEKCEIIVEGISSIMDRLGIRVICEGIETEKQCRDILKIGCHIVQGYYFSKPLPYAEFYRMYDACGGRYSIKFNEDI